MFSVLSLILWPLEVNWMRKAVSSSQRSHGHLEVRGRGRIGHQGCGVLMVLLGVRCK
jgi:hypothetical protein